MKVRVFTLTAALATSAALTLAACGPSNPIGGSSGQTPGTSANPAPGTGASSNPAPAPAPAPAKNFNVCTALPVATASQITGTKFTSTKTSSVEGVVFSCEYRGSGTALLQVTVDVQAGRSEFDTDVTALKTVGHPPNKISGVGDEAFSEPDPAGNAGSVGASAFASYGAVFGDTYIKIGGLTYVTADQGRQIVEELHSKL